MSSGGFIWSGAQFPSVIRLGKQTLEQCTEAVTGRIVVSCCPFKHKYGCQFWNANYKTFCEERGGEEDDEDDGRDVVEVGVSGAMEVNGIPDSDIIMSAVHAVRELVTNYRGEWTKLMHARSDSATGKIKIYVAFEAAYQDTMLPMAGNSAGVAVFVALIRLCRGQHGVNRRISYTGSVNGADGHQTVVGAVQGVPLKHHTEPQDGLFLVSYGDPKQKDKTGTIVDLAELFGVSGYLLI